MQRYLALQRILELGSFTRAAEDMGYTQSSVSQMIASLEEELDMKLLNRSRTGVQLTPEGAELYPFIERALLQYRALQEKVHEIHGLETGIIRVGTISSVTCHWMPALIRDFQARYPKVQFVLHQGDYSSIQEWIKTGAVDFGFVTPPAVTGLQTAVLKDGEMLAVLPEGHPLAGRASIRLAEIADEPYILMEEGHYSEPLNAFQAAGVAPNIHYTVHDDYAIMNMVEAGLGVSILAELVLRRTSQRIARIHVDPPIYRTLAIGYKNLSALPIASRRFIAFLKERASSLP